LIPIRDTLRTETHPVVNYLLIAINTLVFLVELSVGSRLQDFLFLYGLVPARYSVPEISAYFSTNQQLVPFLTFMFLHGGFLHLIGNMWFLYIFGDNIEDHLGHLRYLAFYLLCGLASGLSHLVLNWGSRLPTVGASGAIAGVMGAYFLLHPRAKILTLVPIFFFIQFLEVPAFLFLGIWFVFQFLSAGGSSAGAGGVAWWAHVGGFLFGILFLKVFDWIPRLGADRMVRTVTRRHRTPRLQFIRPSASREDPDLHGVLELTEREARSGARKLVNLDQGFKKRTLFLTIPPGLSEGNTLRFKGLGRLQPGGERGDLYLTVHVTE
jgi:membrane associated rhomboid family serine protease